MRKKHVWAPPIILGPPNIELPATALDYTTLLIDPTCSGSHTEVTSGKTGYVFTIRTLTELTLENPEVNSVISAVFAP